MQEAALAVIAICICVLLSGAVSGRIQGTILTLPMIYVALGLALSPMGLDLVSLDLHGELVRTLAELTLVLILASDASRIPVRSVLKNHSIPVRLLGIGLPLMMVVGTAAAVLIFDNLLFWEAAVLAIVLAPTDAGLGQAVVTNPLVPVRIRQALNIESGLNDGLAMPFLALAVGLLASTERIYGLTDWGRLAVVSILVGAGVGLVVGTLGGHLIRWGGRSRWMTKGALKLAGIVLAVLAYVLAEFLSGNGYVAAFCMGLAAGSVGSGKLTELVREFTDAEIDLLMVFTFMLVFGATMLPLAISTFDARMLVYALLSLVVIRPATVAISQAGAGLRPLTMGFLGWFGPRGIASILYIFIVQEIDITGMPVIYGTVMLTILISVFAHGFTAAPGAKWYGSRIAASVDAERHEREQVPEMPLRHPSQLPR